MATGAKTRDDQIINVGDIVTTTYHKKCIGHKFVVFEITEYESCESGWLVNVHLENNSEKILKSTTGKGIDANWFKKVL